MRRDSNLLSLLQPRAIAVIGATEKSGRVGRTIYEGLLKAGRPLYPVHPTEKTILGRKAYPRPEDLPGDVDLAVIAIGAEKAVEAAERCARHGIPNIIVVAGGFSEVGDEGVLLEERLKAIHEECATRILGPNTLGIFLPDEKLDTIFVEHGDKLLSGSEGGVTFITQSGSVGVEALGLAGVVGFDLRAFVGLGNACDLDELDFLEHFASDERTRCLAFYVESLKPGHARRFLEVARRTARTRPVVMLKAGRTPAGISAVTSHTGRLAGSDRIVDGALQQFGIHRVFDDEELCDAARTLAGLPPAPGNRVAIITPAGGYGVMGADHVESPARTPLRMASLHPETSERIRRATVPFASVQNPVDLTAGASDEMFGAALDAVLEDDGVDIVLCVAFFAPIALSERLVDVVASRAARSRKPVIAFTQYGPWTNDYLRRFHDAGVVAFPSIARAVRAARFLVERARVLRMLEMAPEPAPPGGNASESAGEPAMEIPLSGALDEYQVKQALARRGVAVPRSLVLEPDAPVQAPSFPGPYVIKVCSSAVLHKTDVGGVIVGVQPGDYAEVVASFRSRFPGERVLVEEKVSFVAPELIIGATTDGTLGPALMVGAGGVFAELLKDVAFRLIPCSRNDVVRMIESLTIAPALEGYRGMGADKERLIQLVLGVQSLVMSLGERFAQLDLNPVVWAHDQWVVLDAKLILSPAEQTSAESQK